MLFPVSHLETARSVIPSFSPQGGLGVAGLFPALGDECADFFLIHGRTSFLT